VQNARLSHGDQVLQVIEATTADEVMRRVEDIMPNVDAVLLSVRDLSEDTRRLVSGPIASIADRVDQLVAQEAATISRILASTDSAIARLDLITRDIRQITGGADAKLDRIIANLEEASAEARELMRTARQEVELTGAAAREKLDGVDELLSRSGSVARKIDEDHGTLGRLVNDPAIADNVEEITEDAKGFLGTLFGLKTYVGLRTEYNVFSGLLRNYLSVELATRPDRYYLIEIQKGPRGNYPVISLEYDPVIDRATWVRRAIIEDKARFTFQFARGFGPLAFRFGLKESSGGIGVDYRDRWWDRGITLQADVFDAGVDRLPRAKLTAAVEVFRYFHILAGIDDALNSPSELVIDTGEFDLPTRFDRVRFGRDYFFGAMIRFTDDDLTALLTVGGAALANAAVD
jgi:phospholipid/cholesterol/gamma-HCH transport system substrate-binding protein